MSNLGKLVRAKRNERGLSLQNVADAASLSKAHVWEIERGRADNPSVSTLTALGAALGVSAVELFRATMKQETEEQ